MIIQGVVRITNPLRIPKKIYLQIFYFKLKSLGKKFKEGYYRTLEHKLTSKQVWSIKELVLKYVDTLVGTEIKLDDTFPKSQLLVDGFLTF